MAAPRRSRSELHREALDAARGLPEGDGALVALLRELGHERERATETVSAVVRALAVTLQARDGYTGEHADAVHDLSIAVGERLGLDGDAMAELAAVALLHDVGKIGTPDSILHKPGPLDDAEWEIMRQHPVIGERILSSVPGLEAVARAVRHEHERWDGGGYPDGLSGEAIPLSSRIVLACDAWHALVSDRPYRLALPFEDSLAELRRCGGTQFDPQVTAALIDEVEAPAGKGAGRPDVDALLAGIAGRGGSLERELVALIYVASAVAAANGLEDVLDIAADEALAAIGAASLSIERWLPERGVLRTLVNVGDLAPGEEHHPADEIYHLAGDRVLRRILEEGGTYYCCVDDPDVPEIERELLLALGKHSSVAVPIMFGGETWGQIWASRVADQPAFDDRDARFLHAIGGQIGSAIGRAEVFSHVSDLANTDGLTGLANRRAFDDALELAVLEARGDGHYLALVLCDVDNLKEINDRDGHEAGDEALRTVARALEQAVADRPGSLVCRVGGDEFCLLLHGADDRRGWEVAGALMRQLGSAEPPIGLSCGVAALRAGHGRPADLMRAADAAQYAAKRAGRGRVHVAGPSGVAPGSDLTAPADMVERRALRDAGALDIGRLLTATLHDLDGPLAAATPAERLSGVLRRAAEAAGAAGWTVAFAYDDGEPETLATAGRAGTLSMPARRDASSSGSGPLVLTISSPEGTWLAELGIDARSEALAGIEPVLRVLAPEALRVACFPRLSAALGA